jgi:phosphopantothenoylcysteine synthetase/decarboxylase
VDIAATLSAQKRPDQCCVGFSLEATADVERATAKRARKQLDGMVLNTVEAMNAEGGTFTWIGQSTSDWGPLSKRECAGKILQQVAALV